MTIPGIVLFQNSVLLNVTQRIVFIPNPMDNALRKRSLCRNDLLVAVSRINSAQKSILIHHV